MLTKDFSRAYIPGTPGSPEIPAAPAYTVCYTPENGYWAMSCTRFNVPGKGGSSIPPGGRIVVVRDPTGAIDPLTGEVRVIDVYIEVCAPVWVSAPGSGSPVCTRYPAQPHVPAVAASPGRWEVSPQVGWNAGANSLETHAGDCIAEWTMQRVVGVYIGLTATPANVASPTRLTHAFYFHQKNGSALARVVEAGAARTADVSYDDETVFAIRRARGAVSYLVDGNVVYESRLPSHGQVMLGSALYASGDTAPTASVEPAPATLPLLLNGNVPPDYESAPFILPAGSYTAVESAPGASCDWAITPQGSDDSVAASVEGGSRDFVLATEQTLILTVTAYQDGGPFLLTIDEGP